MTIILPNSPSAVTPMATGMRRNAPLTLLSDYGSASLSARNGFRIPVRFYSGVWGYRISGSSPLLDGYDEPEILVSSTSPICLKGADAGQYTFLTVRNRALYDQVSTRKLDERRMMGSALPLDFLAHYCG